MPHRRRFVAGPLVVAVVLALVAAVPAPAAPASGAAAARPSSDGGGLRIEPAPSLPRPLQGAAALRALGDRVDDAARVNGVSPALLRERLQDPTVWLATDTRMYYVDPAHTVRAAARVVTEGPYPSEQTFLLHSKPGSQRTIFLDFDGATVNGTAWGEPDFGGLADGSHPAWDPAGDGAAFTEAERDAVQSIWQRVAEDYAPFDVDVTTQDPGDDAITRSGSGDEVFGTRALIGPSPSAWAALCQEQCGGVAFIGVFDATSDHARYQPAWVFTDGLGPDDPKSIAEATSHEVGHNMGLQHDGKGGTGYYAGHGPWAPIMGDSYGQPISQWSNGAYTGATQAGVDDVAVIAGSTHGSRADEAVATVAGSPELPVGGTTGYITSRTDVDVWDLGTCSGSVTVTAGVAPTSPNLDVRLRVLDSTGAQVATNNPASARQDRDVATGMAAAVTTTLAAGRYYAELDGVGNGTVNTGYDDYASLGAYALTQSGCSTTPPGSPSAPQSVSATPQPDGRSVQLSWSAPADPGTSAVTEYVVARTGASDVTTSGASLLVSSLTPGTAYTFSVRARNASGLGATGSASATTFSPPGAPTGVAGSQDVDAGTAAVTWGEPANTGGTPVTGYEVRVDGGTWVTKGAALRTHTFTGLTGTSHTLAVRAVNGVGAGTTGSTVVTHGTVPGAVRNLTFTLSGTTAVVDWDPPASDGGSPVTGYEVEEDGDVYAFADPGVMITGLVRGATYVVAVRAVNAIGAGPDSTVSIRVPTAPGAPRIGRAANGAPRGAVTAVARWSPPTSNGGTAITGYQVYAYQLNRRNRVVRTFSTGALRSTLRRAEVRLPAGRYRFAVRARNAVGWGLLSSRSGIGTAR